MEPKIVRSDPEPSDGFIAKRGQFLLIRNVLAVILGLILIALLGLAAFSSVQTQRLVEIDSRRIEQNVAIQEYIRDIADDNNELNTETNKAVMLLQDCLEPTGKCFRDQQKRTADLLGIPEGPINTVVVLAIACADVNGAQTDRQIVRCVEQEIREAKQDERNDRRLERAERAGRSDD